MSRLRVGISPALMRKRFQNAQKNIAKEAGRNGAGGNHFYEFQHKARSRSDALLTEAIREGSGDLLSSSRDMAEDFVAKCVRRRLGHTMAPH